ncbi:SPOR domain-containing protein [Chitinasiproducens palmae]|uniref:Cell division protein FtsN n=1 Tax=Chitinasiproducens palmae TaxID=1770053 RepID=A0A1H2PNX8_9BURK|nr:SPOR domain-containing protein [Chitinasiproducens palmae]SDV48380.1 cell division protein FtsN [Chitinasiproducens palmae]
MATKQRRNAKQAGGTILGVILGLIVGLAIAVVVALYITRSPTPFVSHTTPAGGDGASQPATTTDPNRALAGQTPGRPVESQPTPPNTAPGQPSNPSTGLLDEPEIVEVPGANNRPRTDNTAPVVVPPSAAPDTATPSRPASQPRPTRPATPPAASATPATPTTPAHQQTSPATTPAKPGDSNTGYYLQAGAYRTEADAQQQRANLALQGFSARVTKGESGSVTYYRVRLGPFSNLDDLNKVRRPLTNAGVDTAVIRFTKQ